MKIISNLTLTALVAVVLGIASVTTVYAQTPPANASVLTDAEKAQLKKDYDAVMAANPDLQTEKDGMMKKGEALKAQGDSASADDKTALKTEHMAWEDKVHAAIVGIDPSAEPLIAKVKAAHKQ